MLELKTPLRVATGETDFSVIDAAGNELLLDSCPRNETYLAVMELVRRANAYDQLVASLEWYVEHDDTNDDDQFNDFWIAGRDKARAALTAAKGGA